MSISGSESFIIWCEIYVMPVEYVPVVDMFTLEIFGRAQLQNVYLQLNEEVNCGKLGRGGEHTKHSLYCGNAEIHSDVMIFLSIHTIQWRKKSFAKEHCSYAAT